MTNTVTDRLFATSVAPLAMMVGLLTPGTLVLAADAGEGSACHRLSTATDGSSLASPMSFESLCGDGNKDDIASYCTLLSRNLQYDAADPHIRYFVGSKPMCHDAMSVLAFCKNVKSYEGYAVLKETEAMQVDMDKLKIEQGITQPGDPPDPDAVAMEHARSRAAKVCGTTLEAIHAELCSKADADHEWEFAGKECPSVIRAIRDRECPANRKRYTDGEGGNTTGVDPKVLKKASECDRMDAIVGKASR